MNTHGGCLNPPQEGSNFCSNGCRLIYEGRKQPSKKERQSYEDEERQLIHDIYIKGYGIKPKKEKENQKETKREETTPRKNGE